MKRRQPLISKAPEVTKQVTKQVTNRVTKQVTSKEKGGKERTSPHTHYREKVPQREIALPLRVSAARARVRVRVKAPRKPPATPRRPSDTPRSRRARPPATPPTNARQARQTTCLAAEPLPDSSHHPSTALPAAARSTPSRPPIQPLKTTPSLRRSTMPLQSLRF